MLYSDISDRYHNKYAASKDILAHDLNSIALEEISLSELIDVQASLISYAAKIFNMHNCHIKDIININQSVSSTLTKIIQLNIQQHLILTGILEIVNTTDNAAAPDIIPGISATQPEISDNVCNQVNSGTAKSKAPAASTGLNPEQEANIDTQASLISYAAKIFNMHICHIKDITNKNQSVGSTLMKNIQLNIQQHLMPTGISEIINTTGNAAALDIIPGISTTQPQIPDNVCKQVNSGTAKSKAPDASTEVNPEPEAQIDTHQNFSYCLKGRGSGNVQYHPDRFYGGISIVQTVICPDAKAIDDNFLCYSVHKGTIMEILTAKPATLKIECCFTKDLKKVVVKGEGMIIVKERCKPNIYDTGYFILTVAFTDYTFNEGNFEMEIKASINTDYDHFSGKITADNSKLIIET